MTDEIRRYIEHGKRQINKLEIQRAELMRMLMTVRSPYDRRKLDDNEAIRMTDEAIQANRAVIAAWEETARLEAEAALMESWVAEHQQAGRPGAQPPSAHFLSKTPHPPTH